MSYTAPFESARLTLRPFTPQDMEPAMAFYASERGFWHGAGPKLGAPRAWRVCAILLGQWQIHGWGVYTMTETTTGRAVGSVGPFFPPDHPEVEIGWSVWPDDAEGKGYAAEGARAVIDRFLGVFGWDTLVSYIDPVNTRSVALAERLGATRDDTAPRPHPDDVVYRHRLLP
ncbi:MAG: GNAT family N-acetyltransferase [Pseudomonadota bacterium]